MLNLLRKSNYKTLAFQPFLDYITFLEEQGYEFVSESEEYGWSDYRAECQEHSLEILSFKDEEKEWISIYKTRNEIERFEQIEFMSFNEKYRRINPKQKYNHVIKYAGHFEDEEFARIVCSGYSYEDNILLGGWRKLRKFAVQELDKVMYSKTMNLQELTMMADEKINEFYEVIDLKDDEVKELKLGY